ncbi:hypothetical protein POTOM_037357 [Populus tomentosa]|uniref:Uncharacterized protein n=1 Tax=Populus tomentosa TaxID=118781 RepID=A0A8X8CCH5_POPTO|nr:hypothetical protein POTOM_037357 [Populus tomentosa]
METYIRGWRAAMVNEEWYYSYACAVAMGRREIQQRQLRRGGISRGGEEVVTLGDGLMICNGSRLEIGLWWPFVC